MKPNKNKKGQRSLFDAIDSKKQSKQEKPEIKKKDIVPKRKKTNLTNNKLVNIPETENWKDFSKTKPECLVPVEFCIKTGKKDITFRGYLKTPYCKVTDEPYKLVVLRKKYGNLFYREIDGCTELRDCPDEFPNCDRCKKRKQKSK